MLQSFLPAVYLTLKIELHLNFAQIGFITLAYQVTASLLQPAVGLYADRWPTPFSLPVGTLFTFAGLPVGAAIVALRWGRGGLTAFSVLALVSTGILCGVGFWYKRHGS